MWWHCLLEVTDKRLEYSDLNCLYEGTTLTGCRVKWSTSTKYPLWFLLGCEKSLVCRRPQVLGETEDSNLKLPVCLSVTHQWIPRPFIPSSLQSIAEAAGEGEVSWLLSVSPLNQAYYAGKEPLHPLSCWKDKPKECLKANCVLCTLLRGCLNDKLCFCTLQWSSVCVAIFGNCG